MPCFNERATLRRALDRLLAVDMPLPTEVLVVDDGSTDGCIDTIKDLVEDGAVRLVQQPSTRARARRSQRGFAEATGDLLTILDADLEYDPQDFPHADRADPRRARPASSTAPAPTAATPPTRSGSWSGTSCVALTASILFDAWLTDVETCLKVAPTAPVARGRDHARRASASRPRSPASSSRWASASSRCPISYRARGREEGKKIQWTDGIEALWILLRIRLSRR